MDETPAALLDRPRRDFAPVNKLFVQAAPGSASRHGPLATFVRNRDLRGLHAYLMLLGITSSGDSQDGWSTTLRIGVWPRAFGTTPNATPAPAASAVFKILTRLKQRKPDHPPAQRPRAQDPDHPAARGQLRPAYTGPGKSNSDRFLRSRTPSGATAGTNDSTCRPPPRSWPPCTRRTVSSCRPSGSPNGMTGRPTPPSAAWPPSNS